MPACRWQNGSLVLDCRVQPRASQDEIAGLHGEQLRLRITAPPVDGKANAHLLKFLAGQFGVPRKRVHLLRGESSRDKQLSIENPARIPDALAGLPEMQGHQRE